MTDGLVFLLMLVSYVLGWLMFLAGRWVANRGT